MNHQTIEALFGEKYSTAYSNYHTLITKGEKGNEIAIIFALARYGDKLMAGNLLNSNNKLLTEFAQKWAWDNGYTTSLVLRNRAKQCLSGEGSNLIKFRLIGSDYLRLPKLG